MIENKIDWYIKCENTKKFTIFKDKDEELPVMLLDIINEINEKSRYLDDHVELKKVGNFDVLIAEAVNKDYIRSPKLKIENRRK